MNVIYADSLFLLNAVIDYLILLAVGRICSLPIRRGRLFLSAALGGLYAIGAVLKPALFASPALRVASGAALVWAAYGGDRLLLRAIVIFFAVSAAFGGAVYAAANLAGLPAPGAGYISVSLKVLILSFAVCYCVLSLAFRGAGRRGQRLTHEIALEFLGKTAEFTALYDSGNELCDPISGDSVLIAEASALAPVLPCGPEVPDDPAEALKALSAAEGYSGKFRLIPYSCVASEASLLLCFRPDRLSLDGSESIPRLVAVSTKTLSPTGEYQAII